MVEIAIEYQGGLRTRVTHGPSGCDLLTDAPRDNQGQGESFSPTDLMATALGTCMLTIMGIVARDRGIAWEGAKVRVTKEMVANPRRRIARLPCEFDLPGGVGAEDRERLENAAHTCPVMLSISERIEVPVVFRWGGPEVHER